MVSEFLVLSAFQLLQHTLQAHFQCLAASLHRSAQFVANQAFESQCILHRSGIGFDEQALNQWQQFEKYLAACGQLVIADLLVQLDKAFGMHMG
ncbi:hypothetical protein D3C84_1116200 [compost metagenome]